MHISQRSIVYNTIHVQFPIMSNGAIYSGGSPGADRVIFNTSGTYCA